ncbi:hypothetical protein GF391_04000 [Candidatus Uhrbacteria bacterium]|nr:hypothetical protein [Candidatus Uhrbacteria bacterium]
MREFNPFAAIEIDPGSFDDKPENTRVRVKTAERGEIMPTIFDVEDYLKQTDRADLVQNLGKLNTPRIETALMSDIAQAQSADERMRLRKLLLAAVKNGYPVLEKEQREIYQLIHGRIRNLHWEYMRKLEAGDDAEHEEYLLNSWRRVAWLMSAHNEVMDDEELLFIEEAIVEMQMNSAMHPQSRRPKRVLEMLKNIREAMYFKAFDINN